MSSFFRKLSSRLKKHIKLEITAFLVIAVVATVLVLQSPQILQQNAAAVSPTVQIWETTADQSKLLQPQTAVTFAADSGSNPLTITVDESQKFQQIDGVGASFTDSSAWLVESKLSSTQRQTLMRNLFDSVNGAGLNYLRQPMGASDFALKNYTYDDMSPGQTDPNEANFSINYDLSYIVPVLKQAKQINPNVKIMGSPWSPPAWMKTTNSLNGGSLNQSAYGALAKYFVKYVQAYAGQGLPIDAITVQNEPGNSTTSYPSMVMQPQEEASFVGTALGPAFASAGIKTKIITYDHNWDNTNYATTVLNDTTANPYIDGSSFHCYAGNVDAQNTVHNAFPNKNIYFTECSGGDWSPNFGSNLQWDTRNLVIGAMRDWAKTTQTWNMALDTNHGPTNHGCTNCRGVVTIDQSNGNVIYNVEYYVLGQVGKVVQPGAYRIASNTYGSGSIEDVAFLNPDGSKALIVLNSSSTTQTFKILWGSQSVNYTLPVGAVASFQWQGTAPSITPAATSGPTSSTTPPQPSATPLPSMTPVPTPTPNSTYISHGSMIASASNSPHVSCCIGDMPSAAIDGNISTQWSSGISQQSGQWFQVQLLPAASFNAITIDVGNNTVNYPRSFQVFVTDSKNKLQLVASGVGSGKITQVKFPPQNSKAIRVVLTRSNTNWWSIAEFNVTRAN